MKYQDFRRLLQDVSECATLEAYIAEVGGSVPVTVADEQIIPLLNDLWAYGHDRTIATLRAMSEPTGRAAFAREYALPLRTVENWEASGAGARRAPDYVLDLLAYAIMCDRHVREA